MSDPFYLDAEPYKEESRFFLDAEPYKEPEPARPTWGDAIHDVAKVTGESIFQIPAVAGGLLSDAADLTQRSVLSAFGVKQPERSVFESTAKYADAAKRAFDYVAGAGEDRTAGGVADVFKAAAGSAALPGGPVVNALSGIGAELAHKMFPESEIAPVIGGLTGAGAVGAGKSVANRLVKSGRAFERASVGAKVKDYLREGKRTGMLEDEKTGLAISRLNKAINEVGETEGFGVNRTPEVVLDRIEGRLEAYGSRIENMVANADAQGIKPTLRTSETKALIQSAGASKGALQEGYDEFVRRFNDPVNGWDGTIRGLHKWSSDIRNLGFSGSASGALTPQVQRSLERAIGTDLSNAVKDAAIRAGANPAELTEVFKRYSNLKTVAPIIEEGALKEEASTPAIVLRSLLRTSGGTLSTPTVIGTVLGGAAGGPVGLATGAALGALLSPTGSGLAGSALKGAGRAGQAAANVLSTGAKPGTGFAAGLFSGGKRVPKKEESVPVKEAPKEEAPKKEKAVDETQKLSVSNSGLNLIKKHEGLRLNAYSDSAGKTTIGYGHTGTAKKGQKITEADADKLLKSDVSEAEKAVRELVKVKLTQGQFDALVSFVFNLGKGSFEKSTLLKKLNAGETDLAEEFAKWSSAGGKKLPGLEARRKEESKLFA